MYIRKVANDDKCIFRLITPCIFYNHAMLAGFSIHAATIRFTVDNVFDFIRKTYLEGNIRSLRIQNI